MKRTLQRLIKKYPNLSIVVEHSQYNYVYEDGSKIAGIRYSVAMWNKDLTYRAEASTLKAAADKVEQLIANDPNYTSGGLS